VALQSQSRKRRRRRRGASARAIARPVRLTRGQRQFRLHATEVLASVGVVVAAAALVVLVWINASGAIEAETAATRARIEATASGQALVLADEIRRELLGVEQSLRVLKQAFQVDPVHFDIRAWRDQVPALTDVTEDVFIADAQLIIQHDINPQSIGLGIGSRVAGVLGPVAAQTSHEDNLLIGPTVQRLQNRQHLTFLMIRLDRPGGWLVGAAYRTSALTRLYAEASLGMQGMTALINTKLGRVQAVTGPAAAEPAYDIANTPMYSAMQTRPDGTWIGTSAPDGVERIHGFRRVPGRDLSVVVAVNEAEAMRPAAAWAEGTRSLAWGATLVVLLLTAMALREVWTFRSSRRRNQAIERERAIVASTQLDLTEIRSRLEGRTAQLRALLAGVSEGVLVADRERLVVEWNARFLEVFGVLPEVLQPGLPFDEVLRSQARAGAFGPLEDVEAEVARRMAQLRAGGEIAFAGPDGRSVALLSIPLSDGGLVLVVGEDTGRQPHLSAAAPPAEASPMPARPFEPSPEEGPLETL
jgi:PAS domain-containing protein